MQNGVFQTGNPRWSAVFSLFMGVMALIAAEFIPVSLLTPIARDLAVSEGMAGQTVTAVGVLAVLTSLLLAPLTGNTDRPVSYTHLAVYKRQATPSAWPPIGVPTIPKMSARR